LTAFDVAVIGSGQGGVPLAIDLAAGGKSVVMFERGKLGGTCVNVGCTPSKAFLASAHAAGRARRAAAIGIHADVRVDFPAVMDRVRAIVAEWNSGVEDKLTRSRVTLVRAEASFVEPHVIAAAGERYECATIVIDTGTSPFVPPLEGIGAVPYRTNLDIFDLTELPRRTIVLGAGIIGLELGQGLARLGSQVHIVDQTDRILAIEEPDVSAALQLALDADGVQVYLGTRGSGVARRDGGGIEVRLADGTTLESELLLVAVGRRPNVPPGAVERAGIKLDSHGYVAVDAHLRTNVDDIFALGDCAGQPQFTHVSWEDYRRVKATMLGLGDRTRDDRVLGYAVFTDPQVGRCGLTLEAATARGFDAQAIVLKFEDLARAIEWNETNGFFRLVVDRTTGAILGATFVGYEAGELVHVILAHMEAGSTWRTLERSVHIHPAYAEGLPTLARQLL
jgi:pyruvate/2-oxoglutarate dehydrogenase complex dihydrolipoamide dehydrogenase (E3) component